MSRSGYVDDCDEQWMYALHRGRVASTIRGKKGQAFLRDLAATLDAMPMKELAANVWDEPGAVCAIGTVTRTRGIDTSNLDPEDAHGCEVVAEQLDISPTLAREIVWVNDEGFLGRLVHCSHGRVYMLRIEGPGERWERVRRWVQSQIKEAE